MACGDSHICYFEPNRRTMDLFIVSFLFLVSFQCVFKFSTVQSRFNGSVRTQERISVGQRVVKGCGQRACAVGGTEVDVPSFFIRTEAVPPACPERTPEFRIPSKLLGILESFRISTHA
ncbi:hypothetical protein CDAR_548881 [Caerostris darwini]|uniref:Uncharacterized protein n=1 Tax=Caerostris darwini TaxID=1538125 RepID=A0AAV4WIN8_9ARAC|nr:hypothetical protein CDAR_548881 [Caerostris darwini]